MSEFITAISAPHNSLLTIALGACAIYWIFVICFGVGSEVFHGLSGLFHHGDVGGHDAGLDTHFDGDHAPTISGAALNFFNFGEVPATIILSIILLLTWTTSVVTNKYTRGYPVWLQVLVLVGIFIGALFLSKIITTPMKESYASSEKGPDKTDIIGRECLLTTSVGESRSGTAEAKTDAARFIIIQVRSAPGQGDLPKGARATIVSVDPNAGGYLVRLPGSPVINPSEGGKTK